MSLRAYENNALRNLYHINDDGDPVAACGFSPGDIVCQVAIEASGYGTVIGVSVDMITVLWSEEPNLVGYHYAPYHPLVVTPTFMSSDDEKPDVIQTMRRLKGLLGRAA